MVTIALSFKFTGDVAWEQHTTFGVSDPLKESKLRVDMFAADHVKNRLVRPVGPYFLPVWILIPLDYDRQIMKYVQEPE